MCLVGSVQLLWQAILWVHRHYPWTQAAGYILFAIAGIMVAIFFLRRANKLSREINEPLLTDPGTAPDFSTLNDGSQQWKNLEDVR